MSLFPLSAALALVSCTDFDRGRPGTGFDPGLPPGSGYDAADQEDPLTPGQFVMAVNDNAEFYQNEPERDQVADKFLDRGTSMKIVSVGEKYVKAELDSGEVGYVPAAMVSSRKLDDEVDPATGEIPETGGPKLVPIPAGDPDRLPLDERIPELIDPDFSPE